jgi:hypothetical protein
MLASEIYTFHLVRISNSMLGQLSNGCIICLRISGHFDG